MAGRSLSLGAKPSRRHFASLHPAAAVPKHRFLAERIADVGVRHWFGVPGDFNLSLLDQLLEEPRLKMVSTCNELNAGSVIPLLCCILAILTQMLPQQQCSA